MIARLERIRFPTTPPVTPEQGRPASCWAGGRFDAPLITSCLRTASYCPTQWLGGVELQTLHVVSTHTGWRWQVLLLLSRNQSPGSLLLSLLWHHPVPGLGARTQHGRGGHMGFPPALAGRWDHN